MTLAKTIANAGPLVAFLREKASTPFIPHAETVQLIEWMATVENLAALAAANLKPAPSSAIARAIVDDVMTKFDALQAALKMPAEHMHDHAEKLMGATRAAMAKPKAKSSTTPP